MNMIVLRTLSNQSQEVLFNQEHQDLYLVDLKAKNGNDYGL